MGNFSSIFKDLRIAAGLSQQELAEVLKISRSAVSMYEAGERQPNFELLEVIADYFNVDMNYLLGKSSYTTTVRQPAGDYYLDPEVAAYAQEIYENPELRILLDASRDVSKEDLELVTQMVLKLKNSNK